MDEMSAVLAPQLRALTALADADGHMTQAAAALGIPQSSMSRRIHALETILKTPLLIREGRTVRLTLTALALARSAHEPLRQLDAALASVIDDADGETGIVRFGFPLTMGSGVVPDLLARFRGEHPGIRLHLKQAHGSALFEDLRGGALDVAITIPAPTDLHHTFLATQDIVLVVPDQHRLARASAVGLPELQSEAFIANPPTYNLRQVMEDWCRAAGYPPNVTVEITEFATVRELVSRGLGVALLPRTSRPLPGTVEVPLRGGPFSRDIALTWAVEHQTAAASSLGAFLLREGVVEPQATP